MLQRGGVQLLVAFRKDDGFLFWGTLRSEGVQLEAFQDLPQLYITVVL